MSQYLEALRQAMVIYPMIVVLFTVPYIAWSYHKYGSVLSLRVLIVYSFILYLLCVYCLAPLPELMDRKKRDIMERKGDKEDENKRQKQQKESSAAAL